MADTTAPATNRIDRLFADLCRQRRKAIMPYLTLGDPDLDTSARLLLAMQDAGASICELGFPFSDPIADGPVIQASMNYALHAGATCDRILAMLGKVRSRLSIGLVAMVSYTIVHKRGCGTFVKQAADTGIDGLIVPDLPLEESQPLTALARAAGLTFSHLISPTSPDARARQIARDCSGFVYLLARAGITGERSSLPPDLAPRVRGLREVTSLPIAVGFGVASREHVRQVVEVADAAIVGSAIMRRVADHRDAGPDAVVNAVADFTRELATGLPAPQ